VQTLPSSHDAALSIEMHPADGLQVSVVHTFPSSQLVGAPPRQTPTAQVSPVVQALPSSHDAVFSTWTHPSVASHASSVQGLPSLHPVATHVPPQHIWSDAHSELRTHVVPSHVAVWHGPAVHVVSLHTGY
jgi:hypothetical protein